MTAVRKKKLTPAGKPLAKKRVDIATTKEGAATPSKRRSDLIAARQLDFVQVLQERGFIYQATDLEGLRVAAGKGGLVGYIGFDATAPSLHVGSLVQIMLLRWLQKTGNKPIVLMGGGTTRIGDPSDKDVERPLLSTSVITTHKKKIRRVFERFLQFDDGASAAVMEDNARWLGKIGYLKFLRDVGRHFTINRMLALESVKRRLEREQPLTFMEFNYPLLQAADFLQLHKDYGCQLQMGGSDQWGNIVQGVELCRRVAGIECFGLTSPLITTASGAKMGKTAQGAIWLSAEYLSPFDYWQFWRNTEDADVGRFLKLFTELPLDEIARLEALEGAEINDAKKALANAATEMLHGKQAADEAAEAARATFEGGGDASGLPTISAPRADWIGLRVTAAFEKAGLVASRGEAKRHIAAGALRVNDVAISEETAVLRADDFEAGPVKLSLGRKKHVLLKAE